MSEYAVPILGIFWCSRCQWFPGCSFWVFPATGACIPPVTVAIVLYVPGIRCLGFPASEIQAPIVPFRDVPHLGRFQPRSTRSRHARLHARQVDVAIARGVPDIARAGVSARARDVGRLSARRYLRCGSAPCFCVPHIAHVVGANASLDFGGLERAMALATKKCV